MKLLALIAGIVCLGGPTFANSVGIDFSGPGVSGSLVLRYGAATDAKYPEAYEFKEITGTFSDTNNGLNIVDAPVLSLVAINHAIPEPHNTLAPNDFSRFAVASGLSSVNNGFLTYDNLYWPGGSPQTASDYPPHGGFLDIYGLMFSLGGGRIVDLWSNGSFGGPADYGVAVATSAASLDYVGGGVSASAVAPVPVPGPVWLLASALVGLLVTRRSAKSTTGHAA